MQASNDGETKNQNERRHARLRAIRAIQGSFAHVPFSSDDFARLKQEEIEREEQKFARLFPDTK